MSDLALEDPNNTAEKRTTLHATSPGETITEDFEGDWILQVGPNLTGNRHPFHVVDGIQGLSSDRGGRGVVGQAVGTLDYPGVSGEGRLGVLGTGDDAGIVGLAGFRKAGPTFPFPPTTVMFPGEADPIDPPAKNVIDLPNVGILNAGVAGIVREAPTKHDNAGVFGLNLGGGHGVFGHSQTSNGVAGTSTGGEGVLGVSVSGHGIHGQSTNDRGGLFVSMKQAQIRLRPIESPGPDPRSALPGNALAGDLMAISTQVAGAPFDVSTLWFCTQGDGTASAVWKQVA